MFLSMFFQCFYKSENTWEKTCFLKMFFICKLMFLSSVFYGLAPSPSKGRGTAQPTFLKHIVSPRKKNVKCLLFDRQQPGVL